MKLYNLVQLQLVIAAVRILNFAYAKYETDESKLFESFKAIHPSNKPFFWPEADILDAPTHQRICDNVVDQADEIRVYKNEFKGVRTLEIEKKRVIRDAPVKFEEGVLKLTLIACTYGDATFYLADAGRQKVFHLERDADGKFALKSGPHVVVYLLPWSRESWDF